MTSNWPDRREHWRDKRVAVTGGAEFLGSFSVQKLQDLGVSSLFVRRSRDYDLRHIDTIQRVLADARPDIVVHLAAGVGGIGAIRRHPGQLSYDNLIMGVQLFHESCRAGTEVRGTVCAYPKLTPVPFKEDCLWNGYPEETNAPHALVKKMLLVQSQAHRQEYGSNSIFALPMNLYGPRDNFDFESSDFIPAMIRKFIEAKEQGEKRCVVQG